MLECLKYLATLFYVSKRELVKCPEFLYFHIFYLFHNNVDFFFLENHKLEKKTTKILNLEINLSPACLNFYIFINFTRTCPRQLQFQAASSQRVQQKENPFNQAIVLWADVENTNESLKLKSCVLISITIAVRDNGGNREEKLPIPQTPGCLLQGQEL